MSHDHHLQLPKFIWPIRIVQLVLSVIVLGLSAANVDVASFDAHAFAVFTKSGEEVDLQRLPGSVSGGDRVQRNTVSLSASRVGVDTHQVVPRAALRQRLR
ncbi:uncharacterized protein MYCGRDRAFT_95857 [Zymoseptoria tritici IPO323]|uniref:Uncharacterized protein n=1 Tax=Zymoseptoria tritici (strain CBS 115943 / IPO323) TaxID=336722 RepID=F9XJL1_ZYMTI|nr:uncharacterized protein MYCGRDRAFT_95857 [Zymoseptoria tritici IPO323]EGP84617.1 hypothetical protein MYCGRDRAFT_95857 [Zymoseptoria tritici IPO323]